MDRSGGGIADPTSRARRVRCSPHDGARRQRLPFSVVLAIGQESDRPGDGGRNISALRRGLIGCAGSVAQFDRGHCLSIEPGRRTKRKRPPSLLDEAVVFCDWVRQRLLRKRLGRFARDAPSRAGGRDLARESKVGNTRDTTCPQRHSAISTVSCGRPSTSSAGVRRQQSPQKMALGAKVIAAPPPACMPQHGRSYRAPRRV